MFGNVIPAMLFVAGASAQTANTVAAKPVLTRDAFGMEAIDMPLADGYLHLWNFGLIRGREGTPRPMDAADLYRESSVYLHIQNNTGRQWKRLEPRFTFEGHCRRITRECTSLTNAQKWNYLVVLSEQWAPQVDSITFVLGTKPATGCQEPPCTGPFGGTELPGLEHASSDAEMAAIMVVSADDKNGLHVQGTVDRNYINLADARQAAAVAERKLQAAREAEQTRHQAEQVRETARQAAADAEGRKEAQRQRELVRQQCTAVFKATSNKKVVDLTVAEAQNIRACQQLGFYAAR